MNDDGKTCATKCDGEEVILNSSPNSDFQCRRWCLTINNYSKYDVDAITATSATKNWLYIIGEEIGENGTPHLQIYIETKTSCRFNTLKKLFPTAHIEKAIADRESNLIYCSKDNKFIHNFPWYKECPTIIQEKDFYNWQKQIIDLLKSEPNGRTINWIYDRIGNQGKSALCKYIGYNNIGTYIRNGKSEGIKKVLLDNKISRDIVIDICRSQEQYVSYAVMEELKDGYLFCTKYEGGMKYITTPHIIVFANFLPDLNRLSMDRWEIIELKDFSLNKMSIQEVQHRMCIDN